MRGPANRTGRLPLARKRWRAPPSPACGRRCLDEVEADEGLANRVGLGPSFRTMRRFTDRQLSHARQLRREMTLAETILWRSLRDRGIGEKFRRQVPIGPYVGDFVCVGAKIIVELDGPPHEKFEQQAHDRRRDRWLETEGWRILRFSNDLVIGGSELVLKEIKNAIAAAHSPSSAPC
jgi:very-short-patch-repair endonuclease